MKKSVILILLLCVPVFLSSQGKKGVKLGGKKTADMPGEELNMLEDAEFYYNDKNYLRALPLYVKLSEAHPDYVYYGLQAGICYLYKSDEKEKSVEYLEAVKQASPETQDIAFYLGRAYHINYRFEDAIVWFSKYLKEGKPSVVNKLQAEKYIEFSNNGMAMYDGKMKMNIENMGGVINTAASEYVPIISADESVLIYTYRGERSTGGLMDDGMKADPKGEYYEDVYISQRVGDQWLIPESIGNNINTKGHDACIGLSADGQKLFVFKSSRSGKGNNGDIYMSTLIGGIWGLPVKLGPNVNSNSWEGSCSLSADEHTLYFSSERPGGFGGRDIWVSRKMSDGEWGKAENMGPEINTKYNEDAPFIHPDGITMFFSSEGHKSMGGYDIFYSILKAGKWTAPENMGFPVNTPEDDLFYVLSANGETGYYSSGKKGGFGQQDIYTVSPGFFGEKPILALVVGIVKADNNPVSANINVTNDETGEKQGAYHSNTSTGKYLIALTPGSKYKIAIEVQGYTPNIQYVNVKSVDTYVQVQHDVQMVKKGDQNPQAIEEQPDALQKKIDEQVSKLKEEISSGGYEKSVYQVLLKSEGDKETPGVEYMMEIGTYESVADFYPARIMDVLARERNPELGKIRSRVDERGNTTFSVGPFKTLLDAEIFKYKVFQKDSSITNSVVTVKDNGQRKLVQQYYAPHFKRKDYVPPTDTKVIPAKSQGIMALEAGEVDYGRIVKDHGREKIDGLMFKVEIGAHADTSNFKLRHLSKYGKIEKKLYPDGITRYSIGPIKTLAEADSLKNILVKNEPDAAASFITVFVFGQRKTIPEHYVKKEPVVASAKVETKKEEPKKENTVVYTKEEPKKEETPKEEPIKEETPKTEPVVVTKKEEPKIETSPCSAPTGSEDFSWFAGKDLNDKEVYNKLVNMAGNFCVEGLVFKVQIGAYRYPDNFKYPKLRSLEPPPAEVTPYPDGITRFTMREFKTLKEAEEFRQTVIKKGTNDAWVTPFYNGKRMLMQELIAVNFYGKAVN